MTKLTDKQIEELATKRSVDICKNKSTTCPSCGECYWPACKECFKAGYHSRDDEMKELEKYYSDLIELKTRLAKETFNEIAAIVSPISEATGEAKGINWVLDLVSSSDYACTVSWIRAEAKRRGVKL